MADSHQTRILGRDQAEGIYNTLVALKRCQSPLSAVLETKNISQPLITVSYDNVVIIKQQRCFKFERREPETYANLEEFASAYGLSQSEGILYRECKRMIANGERVNALKHYRDTSGCALKEAWTTLFPEEAAVVRQDKEISTQEARETLILCRQAFVEVIHGGKPFGAEVKRALKAIDELVVDPPLNEP